MKIAGYKIHPAAEIFPMLPPDELEALAQDIAENGQEEPIWLHPDGRVLDGRNRLAACELRGIEPKFRTWDGKGSAVKFVLSKNLRRRHLNPSQLALAALEALPLLELEAKERQRAAGGDRRSKSAAGRTPIAETGTAAEKAAATVGVSSRIVERAKRVLAADPSIKEKIKAGELTWNQAEKQVKRAEQLEQVKTYVPPIGKHQVVSVDFSWKYRDALDGPGMDRPLPYPPMTVEEICTFVRETLPNCCDWTCLLACWVTNPIMLDLETWPVVQAAIQALGFKPVAPVTWRKTNADGSPFVAMGRGPRNNSEQLILFSRGNVVFNDMGAEHEHPIQFTVFDAPVGENSEKPAAAYELLEHLVPYTSRLELFARKPRAGWITSGSELPHGAVMTEKGSENHTEHPIVDVAKSLVLQQGDRYFLTALGAKVVAEHENGAELPHGTEVDPATGVARWLLDAAEKGTGCVPRPLPAAREKALSAAGVLIDWEVVVHGVNAPAVIHGLGGFGPADLKEHAERRRLYVVSDNQPEAATFFWECDGHRNDGKDYATPELAKAAAEHDEAIVRKLVARGTDLRAAVAEAVAAQPAPVQPKRPKKFDLNTMKKLEGT